jgi:hypothetical protein
MKKISILLALCISFISLHAQKNDSPDEKYDTVLTKNGETKIGSVTEITDDAVRFIHKGETLTYTLKKADLVKIIFSSGRVENINDPVNNDSNNAVPKTEHHNKAAIAPFSFLNNQQGGDREMGYKIQSECYNFLSSKATVISIQDPATTNALLGKAGVTLDNFRNYTMAEICDILGVEYIVKGTVTSNMTNTSTSENATYNSKSSGSSGKTSTDKSSSGTVNSSSTTQQDFKTSVLMEIYTDDGKKIFGQDRTSFWTSVDAYKAALQYLLKKTPIYGK